MFTLFATILLTTLQSDAQVLQSSRRSEGALQDLAKADKQRDAGHSDSAIATCMKWLKDPDFDPARFEKKTAEHLAGMIVRGKAQECLALSLEATGKYEEAMTAYSDCTTKHPIPSFCGNAYAEQDVSSKLGQGRCLERLNRHKEAIEIYFAAIEKKGLCRVEAAIVRVVEIYDSSGQLNGLKDYLHRRDLWYVDQESMEGRRIPDLETLEQSLPSRHFRRLVAIAEAEHAGRWGELLEAIQSRMNDDSCFDICRRLARHSSLTVPLLKADLDKGLENRGWVAYALGKCGGADAVTVLRRALPEEPHGWDFHLLLLGLAAAGEPGRVTLRELLKTDPSLKSAVEGACEKSAHLPDYSQIFPPIPKDLKLD